MREEWKHSNVERQLQASYNHQRFNIRRQPMSAKSMTCNVIERERETEREREPGRRVG